jgi:hypothetical protein
MWTVFGIIYLVVGTNLLQVVDSREYQNPQDCLADAMRIMANKEEPHHMACIPVLKPGEET